MISLSITTLKTLMNDLFINQKFDDFLVVEAAITTYNTFTIDGHINKSFYSAEEYEQLTERDCSKWSVVKPICFSLIKGSKPPTKFKIVFALSKEGIASLLTANELNFQTEDINGLYLNLVYADQTLTCTTGTSVKVFTLDKSLEKIWDEQIQKLFSIY